jgi:hypothetical protein
LFRHQFGNKTFRLSLSVCAFNPPEGEGDQRRAAYAAKAKFSFAVKFMLPFLRDASALGTPLYRNHCSRIQLIPILKEQYINTNNLLKAQESVNHMVLYDG